MAKRTAEGEPITIKKYANRRLYNTATSAYVTLEDLAKMVREGNAEEAAVGAGEFASAAKEAGLSTEETADLLSAYFDALQAVENEQRTTEGSTDGLADATGGLGDAAGDAAWDAAWALLVRDLISPRQYDTLTRTWRTVIGPVHPDDADIRP